MTVIAAKVEEGKITMSCDSRYSRGWHGRNSGYPAKMIIGQDFVIGVSGSAMVIPLLSSYATDHGIGSGGSRRITEWCFEFLEFCKTKTSKWEQEGSMILAHKSGLYIVDEWIPLQVSDYCATGSGYQHAEAALYLGKSTREAVDVAINMAYGCGGEILTESVVMAEQ